MYVALYNHKTQEIVYQIECTWHEEAVKCYDTLQNEATARGPDYAAYLGDVPFNFEGV